MRVLDRLKRWFPRSFESVCAELVEGLENGTIVLGPGHEPADAFTSGDSPPQAGIAAGNANTSANPPHPVEHTDAAH